MENNKLLETIVSHLLDIKESQKRIETRVSSLEDGQKRMEGNVNSLENSHSRLAQTIAKSVNRLLKLKISMVIKYPPSLMPEKFKTMLTPKSSNNLTALNRRYKAMTCRFPCLTGRKQLDGKPSKER